MCDQALLLVVEDGHPPAIPLHPHLPADPLQRRFVIRLGHLHEAVLMHRAPRLLIGGKKRCRQRLKVRPLLLEHRSDLPASGPVDARVSHRLFPVPQVLVERRQVLELPSLQRAAPHKRNRPLHFPLVLRVVRPARHRRHSVMPTELRKLGVELRIGPIRLEHASLQVVQIEQVCAPSEVAQPVLQPPQETLGVLTKNRFAVSLA